MTINTDDAENSYICNYDQVATTFHTINIGGDHSVNSGVTILGNGKVDIGTSSTGNHRLAVEGTIGAREIKLRRLVGQTLFLITTTICDLFEKSKTS